MTKPVSPSTVSHRLLIDFDEADFQPLLVHRSYHTFMCTYPTQVRTYHMQVRTYNLWNAHRQRDMYYTSTNHTPCRVPSTFQS